MTTEEINESIDVIVIHHKGKVVPYRFNWKNRSYPVDRVHAYWKERRSDRLIEHHFSVTSGGGPDMFELIYEPYDLTWRLGRVLLEG